MADNTLICVICSGNYTGYGNNAMPLDEGRCCDDCNWKVIIARMRERQRVAKRASQARRDEEIAIRRADEDNKRAKKDEDAMEE